MGEIKFPITSVRNQISYPSNFLSLISYPLPGLAPLTHPLSLARLILGAKSNFLSFGAKSNFLSFILSLSSVRNQISYPFLFLSFILRNQISYPFILRNQISYPLSFEIKFPILQISYPLSLNFLSFPSPPPGPKVAWDNNTFVGLVRTLPDTTLTVRLPGVSLP